MSESPHDNIPKVYFFGTDDGTQIKIGFTTKSLEKRRLEILRGQLSKVDIYLLAAVRGSRSCEQQIHAFFDHLKTDVNSTECFVAAAELVEYVDWLRQQWWSYLDVSDIVDETPAWPEWMPTSDRRVPYESDAIPPGELFQHNIAYSGPLSRTPWRKLSTPAPKFKEDFYTPEEIVQAASKAMGGIDLDAASHWQANRVHKIGRYYHRQRSAFDNPWEGRVWLNPPYGDNAPWFDALLKHWRDRRMTQLCMISPMWAFTTIQAKEVLRCATAMVLLCPTPKFWGNPNGRTGTNHPHGIIYLGRRGNEFRRAFSSFGIPVHICFDEEPTDDWGRPLSAARFFQEAAEALAETAA